jgi:hypothetical protein
MLEPEQFEVNEVWIVFRLNDAPICTELDGDFNVLCLMDAASCYILGNEFVPVEDVGVQAFAAKRLLEAGRSQAQLIAPKILVSAELDAAGLLLVAQRLGIEVVSVVEQELLLFISEARDGFRDHVARRAVETALDDPALRHSQPAFEPRPSRRGC